MTSENLTTVVSLVPWILAALDFAWLIFWDNRKKALEREERRLMIERGIAPPVADPVGWPGVKGRARELKYLERRLRIEKGLDVPLDAMVAHPMSDLLPRRKARAREDYLRRGLVSLFGGIALGISYGILRYGGGPAPADVGDWLLTLAILGPIAALFGLANLLFYALRKPASGATDSARSPAP